MIKKIISLILSAVTVANIIPIVFAAEEHSVRTLLYSEDFESYATGEKPEMDFYESTGSIKVETVGAVKALHIKNINGNANATVEKSIDKIEKKPIEASVRFMQTQTGSSQNKVLELSGDGTSVTVFANAGALYLDETKICDYVANKWYTISLNINLFDSQVDVSVNGERKLTDIATAIMAIEKIAVGASQSPGFWVDDIKLLSTQTMTEMIINGNGTAVIPRNGENEYKFSAVCKDENGEKITVSGIDWSYSPVDYQGITTQTTTDGFIVRVSPGAPEGEITLTASIESGAYSQTKTVALEKVSADEIRIDGDPRISGANGETYLYGYDVVMSDQNGDAVENYGDFRWTMTGLDGYEIPSSIKLNETTGIITVTDETPFREFIKLKATSVDNPDVWQEKKILVTIRDAHILDSMRYNAVKSHIDNVMEYAKDPFDNSPLLADMINVRAKKPGALLMSNGTPAYLHNLGVQSALMRSMVNLSNFENDDKYRNLVNEIYSYNMDIADNRTYLYEGGHMDVDLETKKPNAVNRVDKGNGINETKGGYIYRVPTFNVDYEAAATLAKAAFVGHCGAPSEYRLKNVLVGRHWYCETTQALTPEEVDYYWNNTAIYDWERKGAITKASDCNFLIAYGEMFTLLGEYYEAAATPEEKDQIIKWGDILYSSLDQTGYNPLTGEYNGMFNETNGSKYYEDWSNIYEIWAKEGRHWYDSKKHKKDDAPGDRFFSNTILGDRDLRPVSEGGEGFGPSSDGKSWINTHYDPDPMKGVNEQNWMYFLEPYMFTRENSCIVHIGPGLFKYIDSLEDGSDIKTKIIEKYTNSIYNYLNLRYNWETSRTDAKMVWGLDVTGWKIPHAGYYYGENGQITGKNPEAEILEVVARLCLEAVELANSVDPDALAVNTAGINNEEVKLKDQLLEQAEYLWSVLRNLCKINYDMGDIGDPFNGEPCNLNMGTTANNIAILMGTTRLYHLFGDEQYLKLACNIANNILEIDYDEGVGMFVEPGAIHTLSSGMQLPAFLQLEATLLGDYDNLIEAEVMGTVQPYYESAALSENGGIAEQVPYTWFPSLSEKSVKQSALIIEDSFTMKAGESRKINYTVLPYDAGTGVLWDVSDPSIADISGSGVITAHKRGTVDVRCVSNSVIGLKSETITVTVE